jgi:uncharacterized protein YuzE
MKIEVISDQVAKTAYIKLSDESVSRTVEVAKNALADVDADGNIVGLELLGVDFEEPLDI